MWMSVNETDTTASPVSNVSIQKAPSPASVQMGIAKWAQNASTLTSAGIATVNIAVLMSLAHSPASVSLVSSWQATIAPVLMLMSVAWGPPAVRGVITRTGLSCVDASRVMSWGQMALPAMT